MVGNEGRFDLVIATLGKRKGKTLPKDFAQLLEQASFAELVAVFDDCEREASGGCSKSTATPGPSFVNLAAIQKDGKTLPRVRSSQVLAITELAIFGPCQCAL